MNHVSCCIALVGIFALMGCAGAAAPPNTLENSTHSEEPTESRSAQDSASLGTIGDESEKSHRKSDFEMPKVDFSDRDDSITAFFKSGGIQETSPQSLGKLAGLSSDLECDSVVPVGKPFEQAALCRNQQIRGLWELETFHLLVVADQGKLRIVWQVSTAASLLNRNDTSELPFVQLDISLQDDGQALFLQPTEDFPCDNLRTRIVNAQTEADPEERNSLANLQRMATSLCRGQGKYVWRNNTFIRTGALR